MKKYCLNPKSKLLFYVIEILLVIKTIKNGQSAITKYSLTVSTLSLLDHDCCA